MTISISGTRFVEFDQEFAKIRTNFKRLLGAVEVSYCLVQLGLLKGLNVCRVGTSEHNFLKTTLIVNLVVNYILRAIILNNCTPEGIFKKKKWIFYPIPLNNLAALFLGISLSRSSEEPFSKTLTLTIIVITGLALLQNILIICDHHLSSKKETLLKDLQRDC